MITFCVLRNIHEFLVKIKNVLSVGKLSIWYPILYFFCPAHQKSFMGGGGWPKPHMGLSALNIFVELRIKLSVTCSISLQVVGFHYLGPNAGEVTQGFGIALKLGATKEDFNSLIGIHPTTAESLTTMEITKSSGVDASATGCWG